MLIRYERPEDEDAIHVLTDTAFEPMPFSSGTEAAIIRALRKSGDLSLSLVAEENGKIIGHVAFSRIAINGVHGNWYGLGPIAVDPAFQRKGIGKALVSAGLAILERRGARGCALIGDPKVYGPMGFESDGLLTYENLDRRFVQRKVITGKPPQGELKFSPAFHAVNP